LCAARRGRDCEVPESAPEIEDAAAYERQGTRFERVERKLSGCVLATELCVEETDRSCAAHGRNCPPFCIALMKAQAYEKWYESRRGRWIGVVEYALLKSLLRPDADASLLDIGCGTGHFTRRFARDIRGSVIGLDPNEEWLSYAQSRAESSERYVAGRAEALPFPDRSFDYTVSVTALCFVSDQERAVRELIRVTRRRFALGFAEPA
jgi:SAM-dependent methyltransferase